MADLLFLIVQSLIKPFNMLWPGNEGERERTNELNLWQC